MNQKAIQKLKNLDELRALLSIDDKSKSKSYHTFYKFQGSVLEVELDKKEYQSLSGIRKKLYRKKTKKSNDRQNFELDKANLKDNGVEVERVDLGWQRKLAENEIEYKLLWDKVVSEKAQNTEKGFDNHELNEIKKELKEQLLNARNNYQGIIMAGEREIILMATCTKFIEYLDSLGNSIIATTKIPKRVIIGKLFLSGEANDMFAKLNSWKKVAEHFELKSFRGQFSATAKKELTENENDVFQSHQKEILEFCQTKGVQIKRKDYLRQI